MEREKDEKFKTIVEKLSETMKKYQFDDYDEPVTALVKRLNAAVCSKPLKSPYIKKRGNSTELWAFALQTKDLMEFDYSTNEDYYECSYYDGCQAPFTVLQWEGDLDSLDDIINDWIANLEKRVSMEIHEFDAVKERNRI